MRTEMDDIKQREINLADMYELHERYQKSMSLFRNWFPMTTKPIKLSDLKFSSVTQYVHVIKVRQSLLIKG